MPPNAHETLRRKKTNPDPNLCPLADMLQCGGPHDPSGFLKNVNSMQTPGAGRVVQGVAGRVVQVHSQASTDRVVPLWVRGWWLGHPSY